jgi:deoxyadenosine kinase
MNLPVHYEPVIDNVYLEDFYGDMSKYAFPLQVYLLNKRFRQQQQIIWEGKGGVQDRTIYEDSVFAKMLSNSGVLDARDSQTSMDLFNNMSNFMKKPNVIVHLDVSPQESLRRIKTRNRDCENGVTLEYLTGLHEAYEEFIEDIARVIPVIKVDYNRFHTAEEMAKVIKAEYDQIANVRLVTESSFRTVSPVGAVGAVGKD